MGDEGNHTDNNDITVKESNDEQHNGMDDEEGNAPPSKTAVKKADMLCGEQEQEQQQQHQVEGIPDRSSKTTVITVLSLKDVWAQALPLLETYRDEHDEAFRRRLGEYYTSNPACSIREVIADVYHVWNYQMIHSVWETLVGASYPCLTEDQFATLCCKTKRCRMPWFPEYDRLAFFPRDAPFPDNVAAAFKTTESMARALFSGRRKPYKYQLEDVRKVVASKHGYVLNLEMGLGKTTEAYSLIKYTLATRSNANEPALVVAPLAVMSNWIAEARDYAFSPHDWDHIYVYQGPQRRGGNGYTLRSLVENGGDGTKAIVRIPSDALLILTTYDVLRADSTKTRFLRRVPRFSVVVLDEGHLIRNGTLIDRSSSNEDREDAAAHRGAKRAAAVFSLVPRSRVRYVLTGTPYVNQDTDLMALAKFVNHGASANKISYLTHTSDHTRTQRLGKWIEEYMIIRRKTNVIRYLPRGLPKKYHQVSSLVFGRAERSDYDQCVHDIKQLYREAGSMRECSVALLAKINYLRQMCLSLMVVAEKETVVAWYRGTLDVDDERITRAVRESVKLRTLLLDIYRFGYNRVEEAMVSLHADVLPGRARKEAKEDEETDEKKKQQMMMGKTGYSGGGGTKRRHITDDKSKSSKPSKIVVLDIEDLNDGDDHSLFTQRQRQPRGYRSHPTPERLNASGKDERHQQEEEEEEEEERETDQVRLGEQQLRDERIVLSSESKIAVMLIRVALRNDAVRRMLGVEHLPVPDVIVYTGDVSSLAERERMLQQFSKAGPTRDGRAVVFLMTRATGGLGLNLNRARHILLADGWWNDAAVSQVIDRVHRIGQERSVYVHRYPIEGTIEEYLLLLETRKYEEAMCLWGTEEQQVLAKLRHEALQKRGTGRMLSDMVRYLRESTSSSKRHLSHRGGRSKIECSQTPLQCAVQERNMSMVVDMLESGRYAIDDTVMEWIVEELREEYDKNVVDTILRSGVDLIVGRADWAEVRAAPEPHRLWHFFLRADTNALHRYGDAAKALKTEYGNVARTLMHVKIE